MLAAAGAKVLCSDIDHNVLAVLQRDVSVEIVAPENVYDTSCDVFAPCALGGVLNRETVARLRCGAVAGAANNQLASPEVAELLRRRSILYAPDFVMNVGGAMAITGIEAMGWRREDAEARVIDTVTSALHEVFARAEAEDITTVEAARRIALMALS
jgi:leucine dehydrogenase